MDNHAPEPGRERGMIALKNWAGNYQYSRSDVHYPETLDAVRQLVASNRYLRVLGTRHSFNGIADSLDTLISLDRLDRTIRIDPAKGEGIISANVNYGELSRVLHWEGFALHNMASLPHISVAGACATATHGSGDRNASLASAVCALEIVTADGDLVTLSRGNEHFPAAVVGLGALGVVVSITLKLIPTFDVRQVVYRDLPFETLTAHFDAITSSAYSISLFTDWQSEHIDQVWLKTTDEPPPDFFGALPATRKMHPVARLSAERCTEQFGVPGAWYERLPHFRYDAEPSVGDELQTEYIVPRQHALAAIHAIHELREHIAPYLLISEIRSIAADDLWMSMCHNQDSIGIHFTWQPNWFAVREILPLIEAQIAPYRARPHWGKLFTVSPQTIQSLYPRLADFQRLLEHYDLRGKFRNPFLQKLLWS
jgi:alditol oxidase